MAVLCYIKLARRVSTGVVQLICNQKVGGSNPSPGTSVKNRRASRLEKHCNGGRRQTPLAMGTDCPPVTFKP